MTAHITRIAPSPTGDMHLGTARTAYFNWLIARATGGKFILRIDDTDLVRSDPAYTQVIMDTMAWLGLDSDQVFHQFDRKDLYTDLAHALVKAGLARHDDGAIRLIMDPAVSLDWTDTIAGAIKITDQDRKHIDNLVLLRSDGMASYHFATSVDDMDCAVSWIVRGVDHISNTGKHVAIRKALSNIDWSGRAASDPKWTHLGLITKAKKKLSKRDGASSMLTYRNAGIDPDAMLNFMLRLGWGPTVDDKSAAVIDRTRALELFIDGGCMRASPANLDDALLASLDRKYKGRKESAARKAQQASIS